MRGETGWNRQRRHSWVVIVILAFDLGKLVLRSLRPVVGPASHPLPGPTWGSARRRLSPHLPATPRVTVVHVATKQKEPLPDGSGSSTSGMGRIHPYGVEATPLPAGLGRPPVRTSHMAARDPLEIVPTG